MFDWEITSLKVRDFKLEWLIACLICKVMVVNWCLSYEIDVVTESKSCLACYAMERKCERGYAS